MKYFYCILIALQGLVSAKAQIRIEVAKYPEFLTENKHLYLASDLNNWDAANPDFELKKDKNGVYFLELPDSIAYFEYKFTHGAWALVEGNTKGNSRPNRIYDRSKEPDPKRVQVEIENWERMPAYKFVIKSWPENTPHDASLYIVGNFNNWNPRDSNFKLKKQGDGTFRFLLYSDLNNLEYKITRGNWESVEGGENGKARPNRTFYKKDLVGSNVKDIDIDILSWEDLNGTFNFYSFYDILMLFAALQGLLFIIAIPGIQDYNRAANRWLLLLMGFASLFIAIRVMWQHREIAQAYPKMQLVPDFILFIYAPLFYFYIKKLLFQSVKLPFRWALHFIPAGLMFLVYLPYFFNETQTFKLKIVNHDPDLYTLFSIIGFCAFIFNVYYWWQSYKAIRHYKALYQNRYSYEQNLHYLNAVLIIQATCLVLWGFTGLISGYSRFFLTQINYDIIEKSVDGIWLAFSMITYILGYYAIHQPEVFKMPHSETDIITETRILKTIPPQLLDEKTEEKTPSESKQTDVNIVALAEKVDDFLRKNRTYTNPNLSLNELASKLKIQPHTLSKVINDGFNKNFFDFINAYRIEEFKKLAQNPRYKHHTFVSLAFEVGFNSKTAFNRSFKKMTNQTPREYLSAQEEVQLN
jgi:AraC-like DNA-binding protein